MKRFPIKSIVTACAIAMATAGTPVLAESDDGEFSDIWSKASLTTTYTLNRHLNPFKIDIEVHNGVATLRGTVDSDVERHLAEELALGVDGIREVKNELKISPDASSKYADHQGKSTERSFIEKVEDANLTAMVKSQLLWNSSTGGLSIDVDTHSGVVSLSGDVDSAAESELAEQIARNTRNVLGVKNNLKVHGKKVSADDKIAREMRDAKQNVSDGWITAKVKSAMIYNRNVDANDIDVDTKNGVVILHGRVDSDFEREQAISIAASIKGVKSVKPEFDSN